MAKKIEETFSIGNSVRWRENGWLGQIVGLNGYDGFGPTDVLVKWDQDGNPIGRFSATRARKELKKV